MMAVLDPTMENFSSNFSNSNEQIQELQQSLLKQKYKEYSREKLLKAFHQLKKEEDLKIIKQEYYLIRDEFILKTKTEEEQRLANFLLEGGRKEDYVGVSDPITDEFYEITNQIKESIRLYNSNLELEKQNNLEERKKLIEELKNLLNSDEPIASTLKSFKIIQEKWKLTGHIPQSQTKEIWNNYQHHVSKFYEFLNINNEFRQLELKKNYDHKELLCLKAEDLSKEKYSEAIFHELQKLHTEWKKIGLVTKEKTDEIWQRFKAASDKIHATRQEYLKDYEDKRKQFFQTKTALCEKIENLNTKEAQTAKDWDEISNEIIATQKEWETCDILQSKALEDIEIKKRFKIALDVFYDKKRAFYHDLRNLQTDNFHKKNELCKKTEELANGTITDWEQTTQAIKDIQQEWKEIGAVPARKSEKIWQRFRKACDDFFKLKSEHYAAIKIEQENNYTKKEELLTEIEKYQPSSIEEWRNYLSEVQQKWNAVGFVPLVNKDKIAQRFTQLINVKYDSFNIDEKQRKQLKFENKIKNISSSTDKLELLTKEKKEVEQTINVLKSELLQLENNVAFFGKSKKAVEICAPFYEKIEKAKAEIETLQEKLKMITIAMRNK